VVLAVGLLGPLEVVSDEREVRIVGVKERAVLALLALAAPRAVSAERLVEELWGGELPESGPRQLRVLVSRLRKTLADSGEVIITGPTGYRLAPGVEIDVVSFETLSSRGRAELATGHPESASRLLSEALGLFRGHALEDTPGETARVEAARLEQGRLAVLEARVEADLACGRHAEMVGELQALTGEFAFRERLWAALITALYRSGRQADALRAYQDLRNTLADLGIEPSTDLRTLEDAVLLQKAELDWHPPDSTHRVRSDDSGGSIYSSDTDTSIRGNAHLPTGTVTFLRTEIEGPTRLLEHLGEDLYVQLLAEHRRMVREVIAAGHGVEVSSDAGSFFIVFQEAIDAVAVSLAVQVAIGSISWPNDATVRVRMGLHTGAGRHGGENYAGLAVHLAAQVCSAAHGGQVVVSERTRNAADEGLTDGVTWLALGRHRLGDLGEPVELFQLLHQELEASFPPLRSLEQVAHNLPVQLSSFLGRTEELVLGAKLLAATRLLSLIGPGGIGKTRLAYQLAADKLDEFSDGVWVAELAALSTPDLVAATLLTALGLRDEPGRSATETIVAHLKDRQTLVVLDNCEHLIEAASALASNLLAGCKRLRVLATAREPLRVSGESVWTLEPLGLPDARESDLVVLASSDAVRLFYERAADARVGFALSSENAPAVTAICSRLEGIPLAIELAAARVRTLTLVQIAKRLEESFDLLSKGSRGAGTRQASVQATISWSHDLLSATEQILFRRLSVFVGGFTLEASEGICSGDGLEASEVIDALDGLIDKSLVALGEERAGQGRYRMLETIRAYAAERLGAAGEVPSLGYRHASFYAQLARECAEMGDTASSLDRLEADHPNLLAAIVHLANSDRPLEHGQLSADLASFWDLHGHWQLASRELPRYLARPDRDPALSGRCADVLASISLRLGNYDEARARFTETIDIARELGDRHLESRSVGGLGVISHERGDYSDARACLEKALAIAVELGDPHLMNRWVGGLGTIAGHVKDFPEAKARYQQAVSMAREFGDRRFEGMWLGNLGTVCKEEGSYAEAREQIEQALAIANELGDRRTGTTWIGTLGELGAILGDYSEARSRYGQALEIFRELGDRYAESEQLGRLGMIAINLGEYPEAQAALEEALAIARERGYRQLEEEWFRDLATVASDLGRHPEALAHCREALEVARETGAQDSTLLDVCAEVLSRVDRHEDAAEVLAVADKLNDRTGYARVPWAQARYEATLGACRSLLDEQTLAAISDRVRALEWDAAIDNASAVLEGIQLPVP
jgi:predicted ATPase/DNA-binding SARP family transcriptional activator/class 3 adenylate cyclase